MNESQVGNGLDELFERYEREMQQDGGFRYTSDVAPHERLARIVQYYRRYAARVAEARMKETQEVITWMRGMAIVAQSVSWAETHGEKNARLRGLIEVIEKAITELRQPSYPETYSWDGGMDAWTKSDYPTRELKRRILDQQTTIKQLEAMVEQLSQRGHDTVARDE